MRGEAPLERDEEAGGELDSGTEGLMAASSTSLKDGGEEPPPDLPDGGVSRYQR
jgi:hypothetical protein